MNSISNPLVSIIIPCYNSEKYINRTIESLIGQTYKNLQIVCVNDGSKDRTQGLIVELTKCDSRIELFSKENGGIESALKSGLKLLKGDYTFLIGHDDTLSNNVISEAINTFKNDSNLDAVRPNLNFVFEDPSRKQVMEDSRKLNGKEAFIETIGQWGIHTFCLWRTSIFRKIVEVDAKGAYNFDELATRYLYLHCRSVGSCVGYYNYYQHSQSVTKTINIRLFQSLTTDLLIRQLLNESGLYEKTSQKFEEYALSNIITLGGLFFTLDNLDKRSRVYCLNHLKHAFLSLNRKIILLHLPNVKRKMWYVLLSSFHLFISYLRIRNYYYKFKI